MPRSWLTPAFAVQRSALPVTRVMASRGGRTVSESPCESSPFHVCPSLSVNRYWLVVIAEYGLPPAGAPAAGVEQMGGGAVPLTYATRRLPAATTRNPSPAAIPGVVIPEFCSSRAEKGAP